MKHLYFFCTVIKHPPLGIVLIATVFICILLGVKADRDIIIFINNNSQYFYVDIFIIITTAGDPTFFWVGPTSDYCIPSSPYYNDAQTTDPDLSLIHI